MREIVHGMKLDRYKNHDIEVVIDKLVVSEKDDKRLKQSVATAMQQGEGLIMIYDADTREVSEKRGGAERKPRRLCGHPERISGMEGAVCG